MYSYIYDSFLNDKKYERSLIQLENRVTDLGINGHIHKLSILKSLKEIVQDEINLGATTIVVVGNNKTVSQVIDVIVDKNVTLGIIPFGPDNSIASAIGINSLNAIENLSKRVVEKLDAGKINNSYFLSSVTIANTNAIVEVDNYTITPRFGTYDINIYNFLLSNSKPEGRFPNTAFNPTDGILEVIISKPKKLSIINRLFRTKDRDIKTFLPLEKFKIKRQFIENEPTDQDKELKALVDDKKIIKTPLNIQIVPQCLKVIVGKERNF